MRMQPICHRFALMTCVVLIAAGTARAGDVFGQTNLISNGAVTAQHIDPNLQDPWGLSFSTGSPIWVSDQAASMNFNGSPSGVTTLYSVPGATGGLNSGPTLATFGVINNGNLPPSGENNGPTGQVSTTAPGITTSASQDFQFTAGGSTARAAFIFANLDGSISAWKGGLAQSVVQPTAVVSGASFTGLAIGNTSTGAAQLYAADQNSGNVFVFNSHWQMTGTIAAPAGLPSGYTAFNVQNLSVNGTQTLFVTYANQATGGGVVAEFNTNGTLLTTLISDTAGAHLAAPWGLALAPAGWGQFGGDLLVGNNNPINGLTEINAYNLSGAFVGTLMLDTGQPFSEADLWALSFGNGASGGSSNVLYFTAGLESNSDGLFGAISSVPEPSSAVLGLIAVGLVAGGWQLKRRHRAVKA
jgi:uncharacterized protein (TIGR03118 family)